jgi:tetratricopeptide (TPR) repeat protein
MPGSSASGKTYHEEYVPKAFKLRSEALEAANRASDLENHVRADILISNATILRGRNEPSQAELLAKEAIDLLKRTDGHDEHLITGHSFLAELYTERGELRRAETQIRKQISIAEELYHPAHVEVVSAIQSLARVQVAQGKLGDSRKTISDLRSRLELGNRPVSDHLLRFARTLQQTGRYAEAEDYLREALQVITATDLDPVYASRDSASTNPIVGSLHENQLIQTLDELGHVLIRQGKFVEAENTLIEYLEPLQRLRASEPVSKAFVSRGALRPYVSVLVAQGKHEAAKTTLRRELTLREEALGDDHPRVAESLQYQGAVLRELGDLQQSEALLRRSLRLHRSGLPQKHWYLSKPLQGLAQTLIARRKFSEAENRLLESHSLFEEQVWHHGSRRIAGLRLLVDLYQKWNRPEDAARYQKELDAVTGAPIEASTGMLS